MNIPEPLVNVPPSHLHVIAQGLEPDTHIVVNTDTIALDTLVAIAESLEQERPHLFGFLKSFRNSREEMSTLFRQLIRDDYDNYAAEAVARMPTAPPPPRPAPHTRLKQQGKEEQEEQKENEEKAELDVDMDEETSEESLVFVNMPPPETGVRSVSLQESFDLAQRLEAEEEALQLEQARAVASRLAEEDLRRAQCFYCEICMDEAPIHGAITLDCDHRFCEGTAAGLLMPCWACMQSSSINCARHSVLSPCCSSLRHVKSCSFFVCCRAQSA
jgi:hypothetical protein